MCGVVGSVEHICDYNLVVTISFKIAWIINSLHIITSEMLPIIGEESLKDSCMN